MKWQRLFSLFIVFFSFFFASCKQRTVVLWTSCPEFASYIEDFNISQKNTKVLLVYRENPATEIEDLPKVSPDIVVGSYLLNKNTTKYFVSLNSLFAKNKIEKKAFYPALQKYCKIGMTQRLLPVSFNLPLVIFSKTNAPLIDSPYSLDLAKMKVAAQGFNKKDSRGVFTNMGFASSWDKDFLYVASLLMQASYRQNGDLFSWNEDALQNFFDYIKQWTTQANDSTLQEQDFSFKYLYTPPVSQVLLGHNLFSFSTSKDIFTLNTNRLKDIDFRWVSCYDKIMIQDDIITMGILKKSKNKRYARQFMKWFFQEETQKDIFTKFQQKNLTTQSFGIAGGFSGLQAVNEKVLGQYYQSLIGNVPQPLTLLTPHPLPASWKELKTQLVLPVLKDSTDTTKKNVLSMQQKIDEWKQQQ